MNNSDNKILKEIAVLSMRLGVITFGGPAAYIAIMQKEIVKKLNWLSDQQFLDLFSIANLIPGPTSTEMSILIGNEKAGWKGLIIAGLCFILPAVLITGIFAVFYKDYGQLPQLQPFIYGIKPSIIVIILAAVYPLGKKSLKTIVLGIISSITLILCLFGVNVIYVMFGAGFIALAIEFIRIKKSDSAKSVFPYSLIKLTGTGILGAGNLGIFLTFLKIGAVLYGSGYLLFAFLDSELVAKGIISRQLLMDSIAVGQFTPGPVFSSVTFIGYQINGLTGATVSTIGIFLSSFIFVALLSPLVKKMRNSILFSVFLNAVNVASVAIIVAICYQIGKEAIVDWRTILIAIASLFFAFRFRKINNALIIIGGSALGYLLHFV